LGLVKTKTLNGATESMGAGTAQKAALNLISTLMAARLGRIHDDMMVGMRPENAKLLARAEGIVPAPESTHAVRVAFDEALRCKAEGKAETILFNLSGHGHFDMQAYTDYFAGNLMDQPYDERELEAALSTLPQVG
jgi:predicted alternative tryptophan synthase beta-subunit